MTTTLSSKGQLVLPAAARRKLRLSPGERLSVELRDDGVFLRPFNQTSEYELQRHLTSGLPRMVPKVRPKHKVTAEEIARLNAELL
ncbi:MAG TPA: AbrB/MazE/SpoVT family DNA-binding domain-containing protein [Opitutus sp.]|nr:AbrB/MazE/SpoVT family DNA-binding domain-containing protein [Opitutus sp.]